jgi:hypothetical protein
LGRERVILRTDQEPALIDLAEAVKEDRDELATLEHSPAVETQSNGFVERAMQMVEEQVRTYKLGLEQRIKTSIPNDRAVMARLIQRAGGCVASTKWERTARQLTKDCWASRVGKKCDNSVKEFSTKPRRVSLVSCRPRGNQERVG